MGDNQKIAGSNPVPATNYKNASARSGGVLLWALMDRVKTG